MIPSRFLKRPDPGSMVSGIRVTCLFPDRCIQTSQTIPSRFRVLERPTDCGQCVVALAGVAQHTCRHVVGWVGPVASAGSCNQMICFCDPRPIERMHCARFVPDIIGQLGGIEFRHEHRYGSRDHFGSAVTTSKVITSERRCRPAFAEASLACLSSIRL